MSGYATETPQVSSQFINQQWLKRIESGQEKQAAAESSAFIREIVRQEAAFREILPPAGVADDELDRSTDTDEPQVIIEKEPSSFATFMELQGTPRSFWYRGPRYPVYFGKIASPEFTKSKFQLMTYRNDIRKILADNAVKDIADAEDRYWRRLCALIVNGNAAEQRTFAPSYSSAAFKAGFQKMYNRRRPIGKMLMTKSLLMESIDLPATSVGNAIAETHYREGIENEERLFGVPVVSTIKSDIYDPKECWVFAPQNFLGNSFLLQDATLFIEQKADKIMFHVYEALGVGIGNRLSLQQIVFS
jgi:hypothetical protein